MAEARFRTMRHIDGDDIPYPKQLVQRKDVFRNADLGLVQPFAGFVSFRTWDRRHWRRRPGYLSLVEGGSPVAVSEDALVRIAKAMGIEPWVLLAQAAGLKLEQVEQFTEQERIWLDVYRALDSEQREVLLEVATVMRRPSPRKRGR